MIVSNEELEYYYKTILFGDIDEIKKYIKNIYKNNENILAAIYKIFDKENEDLKKLTWCKEIFFYIVEEKDEESKTEYKVIKKHGKESHVTIYKEGEWLLQQKDIDGV